MGAFLLEVHSMRGVASREMARLQDLMAEAGARTPEEPPSLNMRDFQVRTEQGRGGDRGGQGGGGRGKVAKKTVGGGGGVWCRCSRAMRPTPFQSCLCGSTNRMGRPYPWERSLGGGVFGGEVAGETVLCCSCVREAVGYSLRRSRDWS